MGIVIGIVNAKGGVGKTTTVANLGAALAARGKKVLLGDVDPQGSLTGICGMAEAAVEPTPDHPEGRHLWVVMSRWVDGESAVLGPADVLHPTGYCGADLVAATADLHRADLQLVDVMGRETILRNMLAPLRDLYDIILLDARPALGLLPTNVLAASDWTLIPMVAEPMAKQGLALIVPLLTLVKTRLNPRLGLLGVVITMFRGRLTLTQKVLGELRETVEAAGVPIFKTMVPWATKVGQATDARRAVRMYAPGSRGTVAYDALAEELLARLAQGQPAR